MTWAELEQLVELWRNRLGLQSWELELRPAVEAKRRRDWDVGGEGKPDAATWRARDYETAEVYIADDWAEWPPRKLHAIVVHELLHLVTREVEHVLDLLDEQLAPAQQELVERAHRHAVEGAVDRLAYRLVDLAGDLEPPSP